MSTLTLKLPRPLPHQWPIIRSGSRKKLWRGGRRVGKSVAGRIVAIVGHGPKGADGRPMYRGMLDGANVAWVTKTYRQAKAVWRKLLRTFTPLEGTLVKIERDDKRIEVIGNGGALSVWSGHTRDALDNVRGDAYDGVLLDEAAYFDLDYALREVLQPTLLDSGGWLFVFSTPNAGWDKNEERQAPSYFNRLCREIEDGRVRGWEQWHHRTEDNPRLNQGALVELREEYGPDSATAQQELDALLLVGGLLAIDLDKARNWRPNPPSVVPAHWRLFMGHDWGFRHPFASVLCAIADDGHLVVVDSLHDRGKVPEVIASDTALMLRRWGVSFKDLQYTVAGGDVFNEDKAKGSTGPTIAQQYASAGWPVMRASTARVTGLQNLNAYFRSGRLVVWDTPGNRHLWANLEQRITDPQNPEDVLGQDAIGGRGGDDPYDALRYAVMSHPIAPKAPVEKWDGKTRVAVEAADVAADWREEAVKRQPAPHRGPRAQRMQAPRWGRT